jgi:hypothetical protein
MTRRHFLYGGALGATVRGHAGAQEPNAAALATEARVQKLTAPPKPAIALNHVGFQPKARKTLIYRLTGGPAPTEFSLRSTSSHLGVRFSRPLVKAGGELGDCLLGDFSDFAREGMYQITVGDERSVPFFIRPEAWRRALAKAVGYVSLQRCGIEVPGFHPACHLDDARRRDNGEHVDVTGGWHDAGDARKWMTATMNNGFGLMYLARNMGSAWDLGGAGLKPLLDEMRWGNLYFHKMQDRDGLVWSDTGGGINGDNSDDHWTDNIRGTKDDRHINVGKSGRVQATFVALQAMVAQVFRPSDPAYAQQCLDAALRCWRASRKGAGTAASSWWTRAASELHRASGDDVYRDAAAASASQLLALQVREFIGAQKQVRGFWRAAAGKTECYASATQSALPATVLLEMLRAYPRHADAPRWRDAVRMHLEEYALPMAERSAYRIIPYAVYEGKPSPDGYRRLAGELTYRFFMPLRVSSADNSRLRYARWYGLSSHLLNHAVMLAMAGKVMGHGACRELAWRQLEWIMGANPFGACLMSGEGMRNIYPHSRFVGLIPGGIVNGIAGNLDDEPVLDTEYGYDWRTAEYWSPHNAHFVRSLSELETSLPAT